MKWLFGILLQKGGMSEKWYLERSAVQRIDTPLYKTTFSIQPEESATQFMPPLKKN